MKNATTNAVSTPATNNAEFVIDTKITADGKVTVALNGKKMSLKKAIADLVEADAQIVKIRNEQGETLNYLFNDPFGLNRANLYFYWSFKTNFVDRIARGELDPKTGEPKSLTATTNTVEIDDEATETAATVETENTEVTDNKEETKMTNQTQNAVSTPAIEIQVGTISINASAVGNGRVIVKIYTNNGCKPAKLDNVAAEMPRLSGINIIAHDHRNFIAKGASYNGRYYAKANVYIFTNNSYGTDGFKKTYKFATAKEAVRKLARQELDDKIITAEELEILLAADREIERQREAKREAERAELDAEWAKYEHARHYAAKIALDSKSVNDNFRYCIYCAQQQPVQTALKPSREDDNTDVFDLLPTVDELNDVDTDDEAKTKAVREFGEKLFRVERFSREQVDAVVAAILDGQHNIDAVKKLIDDFKAENFNEAQEVAARIQEIIDAEEAKITEPIDFSNEEKFLRVRKVICTFEVDGRRYWKALDCLGEFSRVNKATAIAILKEFGLTVNEFLTEQEKYIAAEMSKTAADIKAKEEVEPPTNDKPKAAETAEATEPEVKAETESSMVIEVKTSEEMWNAIKADPLNALDANEADTPPTPDEMNASIDRLIADFDREQTEADRERKIAEAVADSMTAEAPHGWAVTFTDAGNYEVTAHGLSTATVDTITAGDYLNPKEFFAKLFLHTQADIDDEREETLRRLEDEREQLMHMRDELVAEHPDEVERLKVIDEMIAETDADIAAFESMVKLKPDKPVEFDKKGNVKNLWF